jgi:hypothetical protein
VLQCDAGSSRDGRPCWAGVNRVVFPVNQALSDPLADLEKATLLIVASIIGSYCTVSFKAPGDKEVHTSWLTADVREGTIGAASRESCIKYEVKKKNVIPTSATSSESQKRHN